MTNELPYGPVIVTAGKRKGQILYYDDCEGRTAFCYVGQMLDACRYHKVPMRYLRVPLINELLERLEKLRTRIFTLTREDEWDVAPWEVHDLWAERDLITQHLINRRTAGEVVQNTSGKSIFLCHASEDKWLIRQVNDDLRNFGAITWLDENNIKVGESIVDKISDGLGGSKFLIIFMSKASFESMWTRKEWQSFLSRQLAGASIRILPALIEDCEIPPILADLKYANFAEDYRVGLEELMAAIS